MPLHTGVAAVTVELEIEPGDEEPGGGDMRGLVINAVVDAATRTDAVTVAEDAADRAFDDHADSTEYGWAQRVWHAQPF